MPVRLYRRHAISCCTSVEQYNSKIYVISTQRLLSINVVLTFEFVDGTLVHLGEKVPVDEEILPARRD